MSLDHFAATATNMAVSAAHTLANGRPTMTDKVTQWVDKSLGINLFSSLTLPFARSHSSPADSAAASSAIPVAIATVAAGFLASNKDNKNQDAAHEAWLYAKQAESAQNKSELASDEAKKSLNSLSDAEQKIRNALC